MEYPIGKVTIIYYTANQEDEKFEKKIIEKLIENSGSLPIISVSRKPIDLGKNICIGEQPRCDSTALKQLLIGLKEAKTDFAIVAESDCLYPPEYFQFIPPTKDNVYRYKNVFIMHGWVGPLYKGKFWQKRFSEGAQMCGREYWIKRLEVALVNQKGWEKTEVPLVFTTKDQYFWSSKNPMVSIKTINGLRKYTGVIGGQKPKDILSYWGGVDDLRKEMFEVI